MLAAVARKDVVGGVLCMAVGAVCLAIASGYRFGSAARMGAGYLPPLLSAALIGLGLAIIGGGLVGRPADGEAHDLRPGCFVLGAILGFALAVERLGLVAAIVILIGLSAFAMRPVRLLELTVFALAMAAFASFLFVGALGIPLPLWPR